MCVCHYDNHSWLENYVAFTRLQRWKYVHWTSCYNDAVRLKRDYHQEISKLNNAQTRGRGSQEKVQNFTKFRIGIVIKTISTSTHWRDWEIATAWMWQNHTKTTVIQASKLYFFSGIRLRIIQRHASRSLEGRSCGWHSARQLGT